MYAPGRTSMRVDSNCKNVPWFRPLKISKKGFFVTNLKLCNSFVEVLPFSLEWNNCDTKFYKDAELTELHKKRKNNNRSKKEIRKTAEIKSKTEID